MKESAIGSTSYRLSLLQAGETWLVAFGKAYPYFVSVPKSVLETSMDWVNWYIPMVKRRSGFWYPSRKLVVGIEETTSTKPVVLCRKKEDRPRSEGVNGRTILCDKYK